MADFKILCPACSSVLSSKKPIPNGKKLTCPHCHKPFVAATSTPASSLDSGSLEFEFDAPAAAPAPKLDTPKIAEKRSHRSIKLPIRSGSRRMVVWTIVIGVVLLAAGGGALGMYYFMLPPEAQVGQKGKGKKSSGEAAVDGKVAQAQNKPRQESRKEGKKSAKADAKGAAAKNDGAKQVVPMAKSDAPMPAAPSPAKRRSADWKEFKSAKGGYTVMFPAPPGERLEREEDIIFYETASELNGFNYEITFHRLKKDDLKTPVKDRLDKIAAEYKDIYVVAPKECEFEGIPKTPVLELTLFRNDKKDVAVERWLVYKDHVFQIAVSGDKEKLGPDQVTRFMQSFKFVADPQGSFLDLTQTAGIPPERKKK